MATTTSLMYCRVTHQEFLRHVIFRCQFYLLKVFFANTPMPVSRD